MRKILFLALSLLLFGCGVSERSLRPVVAVSIAPLKWVVESLADTMVHVETVVPVGVSAENYDPTPRQVALISGADIFFRTGLLGFEDVLAEKMGEDKSVPLCGCVDVLGDRDPHIWLSVRNMRLIASKACAVLKEEYPQMCQVLESRHASLDSLLADMDARFSQCLQGGTVLIVHPSLSYMARDYGFEQIAMEVDGKEPSAAYIKHVFDMIPEKGIDRIYYSVQDNPQEAAAVASEAGIDAREYDPLSPDWKESLERLVEDICRK